MGSRCATGTRPKSFRQARQAGAQRIVVQAMAGEAALEPLALHRRSASRSPYTIVVGALVVEACGAPVLGDLRQVEVVGADPRAPRRSISPARAP